MLKVGYFYRPGGTGRIIFRPGKGTILKVLFKGWEVGEVRI
jgi:hypothetical protein